jgi:uncharacterized protein (TIGR02118 family)
VQACTRPHRGAPHRHILCDSVEAFEASFNPHMQEVMADILNYADITPVIQISEVVVG